MNLPPGVFRYLLIGQAIIPFFINIAVSVVLGALAFRGLESAIHYMPDRHADRAVSGDSGCCQSHTTDRCTTLGASDEWPYISASGKVWSRRDPAARRSGVRCVLLIRK